MIGPTLTGSKISLEPTSPDYLPDFVSWFADMNVTRYLNERFPPTFKREEEWFDNMSRDRTTVHWTIVSAGKPIGVTGIHLIDWISRGAITGTLIGETGEWGKGYATEAVALRTRFAFDELNLERLESMSCGPNLGMHKALERAGYRKIGVRSRYMFREGQWLDMVMFELLRSQWQQTQKST